MKTLLVPVDFTATTGNAVDFAAEWSKKYEYDRIILLKTFYDSMFENITVSAEYIQLNEEYLNSERQKAEAKLQQLCRELAAKTTPNVKVYTAVSELPLLRAIFEILAEEKPDLIIVGSDNYTYSSESFVSGNVIPIAKASPVKVLIVPATYKYQPVQDTLVPCDFNTLATLGRINSLNATAHWKDVRLHVLHVDAKERYLHPDENFKERENRLHDYLKHFSHALHYRNDKNVIAGIIKFTREQDIQLIIALPGKHSFLYNLTHSNILEAIYRNALQPVLILK